MAWNLACTSEPAGCFSSFQIFEDESSQWPISNPPYSLTTQFSIHPIYIGYIYNMMYITRHFMFPPWIYLKWTEIPKYKPQHQEQSARKEQISISHQRTYWIPNAPNSTPDLSDFGISDIQKKMPSNGLVWAYEPLNSCDDGDNIWQVTWPGIIIIQTGQRRGYDLRLGLGEWKALG